MMKVVGGSSLPGVMDGLLFQAQDNMDELRESLQIDARRCAGNVGEIHLHYTIYNDKGGSNVRHIFLTLAPEAIDALVDMLKDGPNMQKNRNKVVAATLPAPGAATPGKVKL